MRKILLIDSGSSSVRRFVKSLSRKGYSVSFQKNPKKAAQPIETNSVDLIAIESNLFSQLNRTRRLQKKYADIPKIILASRDNEHTRDIPLKDNSAIIVDEPISFKVFKHWADYILDRESLKSENIMLRERLRLRDGEIQFFKDASKIISSSSSLHEIMRSIMNAVTSITRAKSWSLLFNDEPFCETIHFRTSKRLRKVRFRKGVGIAGCVWEKDAPIIVNDVIKDKRFNEEVDKILNVRIQSIVCAPLKIKNRVVGVLRVLNKKGEAKFTDDDMNLLVNAASYCSVAIERTFLYEEIKNDDLTNLYNYRYLHQVLDMEVERAVRYGAIFSLIFMDLDNFKKVNDRYGHLIGTKLLIEISQILQKNLRKIDIITRYGGDEFVIILPETPHKSSFLVAERLRRVIEKNFFLKNEGYSIRLTASFGVASCPDDAKTKEELMHIADKAMYRGKFSTKNIVYAAK